VAVGNAAGGKRKHSTADQPNMNELAPPHRGPIPNKSGDGTLLPPFPRSTIADQPVCSLKNGKTEAATLCRRRIAQ
jgi:hypothetical protein